MRAARERQEPSFQADRSGPGGDPGGGPSGGPSGGHGRRRPLLGGAVRFLLYWGAVGGIWLAVTLAGIVVWHAYDLPDVGRLQRFERRPSISFLAADGSLLASFGDLYEDPVPLAELPKHLLDAVLATEDRRFHEHFGIDPLGVARALLVNLRDGRLSQGGSTITQQLAKNVFLTAERSLKRKVQELLLAFWLERNLSKDAILALYLNRMYFGAGAYGVGAAANRYFDKPARRLDLAEAAMLAGLLKAPSRLAPTRDLAAAQARAELVLDNMVDAGWLPAAAAASAKARPAVPRRPPAPAGARYFADWLMDLLPDFVGPNERDLVVRTTLDARLQQAAEAALAELLAREGGRHAVGQGAVVVMSPDGAVRALVGGESYASSQFNRAVQARRQPGSAFKLAVYLAGLEAGLTPDTVMQDQPITIAGYQPRNYNGRFQGAMTLRQALAQSINTIAVQVMERAGRERVIEAAKRLGMGGGFEPNASLALGTGEVTLIDLTAAYATVGNGGNTAMPYGLVEIVDDGGGALYRRTGQALGRAVAQQVALTLTGMLEAVIAEGTGRAARLDRPAAGKTGTSQEFRDAWFVGFTADYVAGVWLGNDDGQPMREVTGGNLPARLWREVMLAAHAGRAARPLLAYRADEPQGMLQRLFGAQPAPQVPTAGHRDFRYLDEKERP